MKGVLSLACTALFVIVTAAHAASEADLRRAETLYQQGQFEEARAIYQSVPKSDKFYETALRRLGAFALYKNHLAEAELMLADAHARNPIDVSCDTLLAETYVREGKYFDMADLLRQLRRPDRAAEFELFGKSQPFRIAGKPATATIPLQWTDPVPVVRATLNGLDGLFMLDTGAPELILDPEFAKAAHVPLTSPPAGASGGAGNAVFGRVAKFVLPGVEVNDVPAMMLNTRAFLPLSREKRLAGVIGTEFLSHFRFTLDYPHDRLVLEPPDSAPRSSGVFAEIPFWFVGDHFLLAEGRVDAAAKQLFVINTGVGGYAFAAPESTLRGAGIGVPTPKGAQLGVVSPSAPFPIKQLSLGSLDEKNLNGMYGPFPPPLEMELGVHVGGMIAQKFFEPYAVSFDFVRMVISVRK